MSFPMSFYAVDASRLNADFERAVGDLLLRAGIPPKVSGYYYLKAAVRISVEICCGSTVQNLYEAVAERFDTTASGVESAIRNAITTAHNRGSIVNLNTVLGFPLFNANVKPTNFEFIALIADRLASSCCPT